MKILVICQYYYPEPVRITDICEELVKRGNEVTVITGVPNYPMGDIYFGYENRKNRDEIINNVKIHRCFTIPRKKGVVKRILNYYSFAISSTLYCSKIKEDYDVVLVNQLSPIMMAYGGIKYKRKHKKNLVMYCLDIWPESLKVGGIKENSIIFKIFHKISKRIYSNCDKILITSKSFEKYLTSKFKIDKSMIEYLPQYAENIFNADDCTKENKDSIDLMFAGNLGVTQSLNTIIEAAEKLQDNKKLYFHFVGDGSEYEKIKKEAKEKKLKNVIFYGRKPLEEMPRFYKMADAMLVTLNGDSAVSYTLPGKVQSYMAAGKPIIGAINGDAKKVIEEAKCGFCGKADDANELVQNIKKFINYQNKIELGKNAHDYYNKFYEKKKFFTFLIKTLAENAKKQEE